MSRKRGPKRAVIVIDIDTYAGSDTSIPACNTEVVEYEYQVVMPECYSTPSEVMCHATPYDCALPPYSEPEQLSRLVCCPAACAMETCSMVYYEIENQLQLPNLTLASNISYNYDTHEVEESVYEEEECVCPRKERRLLSDRYNEDEGTSNATTSKNKVRRARKHKRSHVQQTGSVPLSSKPNSNIYRAKEGYLVEEPAEPELELEREREPHERN